MSISNNKLPGKLRRSSVRVLAIVVACIAIAHGVAATYRYGTPSPIATVEDLRAYVCGAQAIIAGRSPYQIEPLRSCEQAKAADVGSTLPLPWLVVPVLMPPPGLIAFEPLARLPTVFAFSLFFVFTIASLLISARALVQIAPVLPLSVVVLALVVGVWYTNFFLGQIVPIVFALFLTAATALRARNAIGAAIALAFAASFEPHFAIGSLAASYFYGGRAFRRMMMFLASMVLVWMAFEPQLFMSYIVEVRTHASAEIDWIGGQYGTAAHVRAAGFSAGVALAASASGVVIGYLVGVVVAARLYERTRETALLILVPIPFSLASAAYSHTTDLCLGALPTLALAYCFPQHRKLFIAAFFATIFPWFDALRAFPYFHEASAIKLNLALVDATPMSFPASSLWRRYIEILSTSTTRNVTPIVIEHLVSTFALITLCAICIAMSRRTSIVARSH